MAEELLEYIRYRLDDLSAGQDRLENKLDNVRDSLITNRAELASVKATLTEHDDVLFMGHKGNKSITLQLAEINSELSGQYAKETSSLFTRERIKANAKVIGSILATAIIVVLSWYFGLPT